MIKGSHHTPESKAKIVLVCTGRHHTLETRTKMSNNRTGKPHPNKGHPISPETRAKLSVTMTGKKHTDETRAKIAASGRNRHPSPETREKLSAWQHGKVLSEEHKKKLSDANKGKKHSPETLEKMSRAQRNISLEARKNKSIAKLGAKNNNWHGGISYEPYCPKWTEDLRTRIRAFFEHRCVCCGKHQSEEVRKLSCHHVEYNKKACCDGKPVQFAALCNKHHGATNRDRDRWEAMLHRIIDEIYGGRSYFTKEEYEVCDKSWGDEE